MSRILPVGGAGIAQQIKDLAGLRKSIKELQAEPPNEVRDLLLENGKELERMGEQLLEMQGVYPQAIKYSPRSNIIL